MCQGWDKSKHTQSSRSKTIKVKYTSDDTVQYKWHVKIVAQFTMRNKLKSKSTDSGRLVIYLWESERLGILEGEFILRTRHGSGEWLIQRNSRRWITDQVYEGVGRVFKKPNLIKKIMFSIYLHCDNTLLKFLLKI